jgi:hypothetical protein
LNSNTFAGNTSTNAIAIQNAGATVNFSNNLVYGNSGGVTSTPAIGGNGCNISQSGVGGINTDPLFSTGIRGDYHLSEGSPAVDACSAGPAKDLDNVARPKDGDDTPGASEFDIGAFEFDCTPLGAAPTVVIAESGNNVELAWTADPNAAEYRVYRDTSPYYIPSGGTLVQAGANSPWSGLGTGDTVTNYYYFLEAVDCTGTSVAAQHVGEFDFAIVPGTP